MAAGEYISVQLAARRRGSRPHDRGRGARARTARGELRELAKIYEDRGVEPGLARLVAEQLMAHDELGAHMRDELGITEIATARPFQAAWTSAVAFTAGALLPAARGHRSRPISVRIVVCRGRRAARARSGSVRSARYAGGARWQRGRRASRRVVVGRDGAHLRASAGSSARNV